MRLPAPYPLPPLLPITCFPRRVVARQLYSGAKRSPAHESNVLICFLDGMLVPRGGLLSASRSRKPSFRQTGFSETGLPVLIILGNLASGIRGSRKPNFRCCRFSETQTA